ncbi:putative membrane protein [Escherichia coli TW07509]|nr:putative membrane protein [Escherichia coli TW07509]
MNVISNSLFFSYLFSFLFLVCPWDIGFDVFLYRFLCP